MVTKEAIKGFPDSPGVYLMKEAGGAIIYVGKALSLKKRVSSYFLKHPSDVKTQVMLSYVRRIEFQKTSSEYEALLLEARLIGLYKPRFNVILKDDKSFPYVKITQGDIPRVFIGRRKKGETGYDYFGPYTSAKLLRQALKVLRKSFPYGTCRKFPKRACLNYHLHLCAAPCAGKTSRKRYRDIIRGLEDFLTKKDDELIEDLSVQMRALVEKEKFEEAARVRDQLEALTLLIPLKKGDSGAPALSRDFEKIGLKKQPRRVEAFDISNISGEEAVGSMVSFYDGVPDKDHYRRFKVRTVAGIDDYAMIREVVRRRYERLSREGGLWPDLIVIDGGAGHRTAARCVLVDLRLDIPIIAIAKNEELIYTSSHRAPVKLRADSLFLRLIERMRDEAHRFALKYHHVLRKKKMFKES